MTESAALFILDILKFAVSGLLVFFAAYIFLRPHLDLQSRLKLLDLKKASLATTLPLRLQAYERMILLVERITPSNLLLRLHTPGISATEFQQLLTAEVRNEFQHNVTQQIYVSDAAWSVVRKIKEDTLNVINNAAKGLPAGSSSLELSTVVLHHLARLEQDPYEAALAVIRRDVQDLF